MSYLDVPRLVFAGKFQADPSTINNDPEHFDSADFRSNYQVPGQGATNGWWNPGGTGGWRFFGCTVQAVTYLDGTWCDDPALDSIVGLPVTGADARVEGKLVDLDPEQQMVSEIWGLQVLVRTADGGVILESLMYSLELQARQLMQTPSGRNDGTTAGPSFQLPFPL